MSYGMETPKKKLLQDHFDQFLDKVSDHTSESEVELAAAFLTNIKNENGVKHESSESTISDPQREKWLQFLGSPNKAREFKLHFPRNNFVNGTGKDGMTMGNNFPFKIVGSYSGQLIHDWSHPLRLMVSLDEFSQKFSLSESAHHSIWFAAFGYCFKNTAPGIFDSIMSLIREDDKLNWAQAAQCIVDDAATKLGADWYEYTSTWLSTIKQEKTLESYINEFLLSVYTLINWKGRIVEYTIVKQFINGVKWPDLRQSLHKSVVDSQVLGKTITLRMLADMAKGHHQAFRETRTTKSEEKQSKNSDKPARRPDQTAEPKTEPKQPNTRESSFRERKPRPDAQQTSQTPPKTQGNAQKPESQIQQQKPPGTPARKEGVSSLGLADRLIIVPVELNGHKLKALVDTGASSTCVTDDVANKLNMSRAIGGGSIHFGALTFPRVNSIANVLKYEEKSIENLDIVVLPSSCQQEEFDLWMGLDVILKLEILEWKSLPQPSHMVKVNHISTTPSQSILIHEEEYPPELKKAIQINKELDPTMKINHPEAVLKLSFDSDPIEPSKPNRISPHAYPVVREFIAKGLRENSIKEVQNTGKFHCSLVVAPKFNSEGNQSGFRVCIDATIANKHTLFPMPAYLPNTHDIIDQLSSCIMGNELDVANCYQQFSLDPAIVGDMTFAFEGSIYACVTVPFGIRDAPSFVQDFFAKQLTQFCIKPWIDNFIQGFKSKDEALSSTLRLVQCLNNLGVRVNWEKTHLFQSCLDFLGFRYDFATKKLRPHPSKLAAIAALQEPRNAHEAASYAGMGSFLRQFIPHCSDVLDFLDKLKQRKQRFTLTKEEKLQWQKFKEAFSGDISLDAIDWSLPFLVRSDASEIGLGATLFQVQSDGSLSLVMFASHKLHGSEQKWTIFQKEAAAVKFAFTEFRHYLEQRPFHLHSDNLSLIRNLRTKDNNKTISRWSNEIFSFNFIPHHIPGVENGIADILSRSPTSAVNALIELPKLLVDPHKDSYTEEEKHSILSAFHLESGHSSHALPEIIKSRGFDWKGIVADVKRFTSQCHNCQLINSGHNLRDMIRSFPLVSSNHLWAVDILYLPKDFEYQFLLHIVDAFSGFSLLFPQMDKSASTTARNVASSISNFGPPKFLHSDQGTEFVNEILKSLVDDFGINHRIGVAYHPEASGLVERSHREVLAVLSKALLSGKGSWLDYIRWTQIVLNARPSSKGFSPFFLMFHREFPSVFNSTMTFDPNVSVAQMVDDLISQAKFVDGELLPSIRSHLEKYQASEIAKRSKRSRPSKPVAVGDIVYRQLEHPENKLAARYEGPFAIEGVEDGAISLRELDSGKILPRTTTTNKLKRVVAKNQKNQQTNATNNSNASKATFEDNSEGLSLLVGTKTRGFKPSQRFLESLQN